MSKFEIGQEVYYIDCYGKVDRQTIVSANDRDNYYAITSVCDAVSHGCKEDKLFATELEAYQQLAKQLGEQSAEVQNHINALEAINHLNNLNNV